MILWVPDRNWIRPTSSKKNTMAHCSYSLYDAVDVRVTFFLTLDKKRTVEI